MKTNFEIRKKIIAMYNNGDSVKYMSNYLDLSEVSVNQYIHTLKKNKLISRRKIDKKKQGENHNRAKLTEKQAREIIYARLNGEKYRDIAKKYNIHEVTCRDICIGKIWKHLFDPNFEYTNVTEKIQKHEN
jgi:transposase